MLICDSGDLAAPLHYIVDNGAESIACGQACVVAKAIRKHHLTAVRP